MTQYWNHHYFKFVLSGILAKLALLTELVLVAGNGDRLQAQIIPDRSLGNEASVVTPNAEIKGLPAERIDGGAIRDSNLFHSFQEFNIGDLQRVYFANPEGITNIFSRVTGSNLSEIFGTLGVNGNANLFLLNPNGIIFGENASLDVGGSFAASTANAIQFGERGFFSATEPEQPPLLTVQPSAFFFNQINLGRIENRSTAPAGVDLLGDPLSGLRVPDGQSLLLLGGDIVIDGGELNALGGRIELAGVKDLGTIGLNVENNNLSLSFPEEIALADVLIRNLGRVNVIADSGGSIIIKARNIEIVESILAAGIESGLGGVDNQAGDIIFNATEATTVRGSRILNRLNRDALGQGGDIKITTESLSIKDFSDVATVTFGQGNAGSVLVQASGQVSLSEGSTIFNIVIGSDAIGNAGGVEIKADSLFLLEGAQIQASNDDGGQGNAGNVNINVGDRIVFDGVFSDGFASGIFNTVDPGGVGNSGDIKITTGSLILSNGARLQTENEGQGNAGNVDINVREHILSFFWQKTLTSRDGMNASQPLSFYRIDAFVVKYLYETITRI